VALAVANAHPKTIVAVAGIALTVRSRKEEVRRRKEEGWFLRIVFNCEANPNSQFPIPLSRKEEG